MNKVERSSGWGCTVCGYIYTPGTIDAARAGIDPARTFEGLPEDWKCPECGSAKHKFKHAKHGKEKK